VRVFFYLHQSLDALAQQQQLAEKKYKNMVAKLKAEIAELEEETDLPTDFAGKKKTQDHVVIFDLSPRVSGAFNCQWGAEEGRGADQGGGAEAEHFGDAAEGSEF